MIIAGRLVAPIWGHIRKITSTVALKQTAFEHVVLAHDAVSTSGTGTLPPVRLGTIQYDSTGGATAAQQMIFTGMIGRMRDQLDHLEGD